MKIVQLAMLCSSIVLTALSLPANAVDTLSVGKDAAVQWDGSGSALATLDPEYRTIVDPNLILVGNTPGDLMDFDHPDFSGSLVPRQLSQGENIASGTLERGGSINVPTVLVFTESFTRQDFKEALAEMLDEVTGGENQAFERKNSNALGTLIIIDLGARFGVNRIRFYPRNTVHFAPTAPFEGDFMRAYELFVNDGLNLTQDGFPIYSLLVENPANNEPVVEVRLDPPQYIRFLRLRAASPIDFEIDEIEIFGAGFLPNTRYISDIFDVKLASWGNIRWQEQVVGDAEKSRLIISTRSGSDDSPFIYFRRRIDKRDAPEVSASLVDPNQPLRREEYFDLPAIDNAGVEWEAGPVKEDLQNWSSWSPPYGIEATGELGTPIVSPSPARYIQFQVIATSQDIQSARILDEISLTYLTPPLADAFVAEIFPREVDVSKSTTFTYAVRPRMESPDLLGFDTFEISTPIRIEALERIEILNQDGSMREEHIFTESATLVNGDFQILAITDKGFRVRFPAISENNSLLKITFRTAVLRFNTEFRGQASLSTETGSFQNTVSGNSAELGDGDSPNRSSTTVASPAVIRRNRLVDALELLPNPFTPNRDGVNDQVAITYNVLALTKAGDVKVRIFDLAGRLVKSLQNERLGSGRYTLSWDGTDDQGKSVQPGIYLLQIAVEGDEHGDALVHSVAVAY
jgi:hypothetical protein